jgi:large subunit ribosomal protein L5
MSTVQGDDSVKAEEASQEPESEAKEASPKPEGKAKQPAKPRARGQSASRSSGSRGGGRARAAAAVVEEEAPASSPEVNGLPRPRLLDLYRSEVVPAMMQEMQYANVMQVPRLRKVVLNIGLGEALTNGRAIESATRDLTTISGQKPVVARARKSIAGFKLREGSPIGVTVTLRGHRMYHFVDRLLNMALPRIRDFRGVSATSFDGRGNYSLGIREQIIFPEIDYNQIERIRGFQVTITTSAKTDGEAARLLSLMGMPFVREN